MKYPSESERKILASHDGLYARRVEVVAEYRISSTLWWGDCIVHDAESGYIRMHPPSVRESPQPSWHPTFAAAEAAILATGQHRRRLFPAAEVETRPDGGIVLDSSIYYATDPDDPGVTMLGRQYASVGEALRARAAMPDAAHWKGRAAMLDRAWELNETDVRR